MEEQTKNDITRISKLIEKDSNDDVMLELTCFSFSIALELTKRSYKVLRESWCNEGAIELLPHVDIGDANGVITEHTAYLAIIKNGVISPYIPSMEDILAHNWIVKE